MWNQPVKWAMSFFNILRKWQSKFSTMVYLQIARFLVWCGVVRCGVVWYSTIYMYYVGLNPETHPIYIMVLAVRRNGFVLVVFDVFWVIFWFLLIFFDFFWFFFQFFKIFIYLFIYLFFFSIFRLFFQIFFVVAIFPFFRCFFQNFISF